MKSNYERAKFIRNYWLIAGAVLLLVIGFLLFAWGELDYRHYIILGILCVGLIVIFCVSYYQMNSIYHDLEEMSQSMNDLIVNEERIPEEVYREGAVGILYSNYYKLVRALQDSRNREKDEKVFLRDIISDISHQLKTPLTSLNVFMDLLLEDKVTDPEKRKQILHEAENQLDRMEWMVLSMLKLARIEAGAIQFEKKECRTRALLMEAVESVRLLAEKKEQTILLTCPEDSVIFCDGDWLVEAVINLLKNASDYSDMHKEIRVELEETDIYTRIYIKDEGTGIAEEELPNIFKRFYRVNHSVNPNSVGIGLSLTKSIIEGMGGSISVKSELGSCTWFMITFVK